LGEIVEATVGCRIEEHQVLEVADFPIDPSVDNCCHLHFDELLTMLLQMLIHVFSDSLVLEDKQQRSLLVVHPQFQSIVLEHIAVTTHVLNVSQAEFDSPLVGAVYNRIEQQLVFYNPKDSVHHTLTGHPSALGHMLQLAVLVQFLKLAETLVEGCFYQCPNELLPLPTSYRLVIDLQQSIVNLKEP